MPILPALFVATLSQAVPAADETPAPRVTYALRTEIEFDDLKLDAELVRPGDSYVFNRKTAQFPSMISLRTDFNEQMSRSVDLVK